MNRKIIFIASDFSGLGKGTFSASLGRLLKNQGIDVRIMKCDLYFNFDAGTISPEEHGEVYVLVDGTEVDQDFGIYERFLGVEATSTDYLTSGQVFHQIYLNERAGEYLGQTVSVEHVIDEIKSRIEVFADQCDIGIVELGATIGDIKGVFFLEACRQISSELSEENTLFVLLSLFPYLDNVHELKTMGCQRSVNELRGKGLEPDIIIARTMDTPELQPYEIAKIEKFCEVGSDAIFCLPNLVDEYTIPKYLSDLALDKYVCKQLSMPFEKGPALDEWYNKFSKKNDLKVALVGKYPHSDAYVSIRHQLRLLGVENVVQMLRPQNLDDFDAVILPGGWGSRGVEEIIEAAGICRREHIPCLGICFGLQLMVIEYARNVMEINNATSKEFGNENGTFVVVLQEEQKNLHNLGGTSRLGNWTTKLEPSSIIAEIYKSTEIVQRHRHRYEIESTIDYGMFRIVGRDKRTGLVEAMELDNHPFYVGVQYHPEFKPDPNPIFIALLNAARYRRATMIEKRETYFSTIDSNRPTTYLENIDIRNEHILRKLSQMDLIELKECGITVEQQKYLAKFFNALDEKEHLMDQLESEIKQYEAQIREINLNPDRLDGKPLLSSQQKAILELDKKIKEKQIKMRNLREYYQTLFMQYDEALGRPIALGTAKEVMK